MAFPRRSCSDTPKSGLCQDYKLRYGYNDQDAPYCEQALAPLLLIPISQSYQFLAFLVIPDTAKHKRDNNEEDTPENLYYPRDSELIYNR